MWWNSSAEIRDWMNKISIRLMRLEKDITEIKAKQFDGEHVFASFSEKINELHGILVTHQTIDQFDYMKNIEKINEVINEFKECVCGEKGVLCEVKKKKPRKKAAPKKKTTPVE